MIKLLNFHFSASNSVAVSGLGIGFQVILKKLTKKKITYPTFKSGTILSIVCETTRLDCINPYNKILVPSIYIKVNKKTIKKNVYLSAHKLP